VEGETLDADPSSTGLDMSCCIVLSISIVRGHKRGIAELADRHG
jgi:hypothetical protein